MAACKKAQIGWLIDFASAAIDDHNPREGKEPEQAEKCLIRKEDVLELKEHSIECIESSAEGGNLINHPCLAYILFRWRDFLESDCARVKEWTNEQLKNDISLSFLALAFTSESWSHGMGIDGLGDRVSIRNVKAAVDGLDSIIDVIEFRRRLEEIEKNNNFDEKIENLFWSS